MENWEHFNFEQRKIIRQLLTQNSKLYEIATLLGKDPTSVSKEIKRNRITMKKNLHQPKHNSCNKSRRYPYVCDGCPLKYNCSNDRFTYDASKADEAASLRLTHSRVGINMTPEELGALSAIIKNGVDQNESIYHIVHDNDEVKVSVPTVYRYINHGFLDTKRMDLPYAVAYKKRKVAQKYEYRENVSIDRTNRTYIDYLNFLKENPGIYPVQMDFLGAIKSDKKSILVMTISQLHYVLLFLVDSAHQKKVEDIYNQLELALLTENFKKVFPVVLTDRDTSFSGFDSIETSILTKDKRTLIFYCDPMASIQKAVVEQMNKQLRRFIPKGSSIDQMSLEALKDIENRINTTRIPSLSGFTPDEAFEAAYNREILRTLKHIII